MQRTENYRLFKPESADNGSPEPFNGNADVIDAELNRLSTGLSRVDNALVAAQGVLESGITSAKVSKLDALPTRTQLETSLSGKANKSDITNISITGTTNNTGSNIPAGTLFYLNGTFCKALVDISAGATFTEGTNYTSWSLKNTQDKVTVELIPNVLFIDKVGKLCILHTGGTIVVPAGSYQSYAPVKEVNIPTGFRPVNRASSFAVSSNKNIYAIELLNSSNKLLITVWSPNQIIVEDNEFVQFAIPYFTND